MGKEPEEKLLEVIFGERETISWMTKGEKINLVLGGLKAGGFNDKIEVDDEFGFQGQFGLEELLSTSRGENPEGVDLMITIFRNLGFNPALRVGGWVGDETRTAVENFREWLKKED